MKSSPGSLVSIAFLSVVLSFVGVCALSASEGGTGDVGNGSVYVGAYYPIPGSGEWASFDVGIPDDPMEYNFQLKCFDDNAGDIDCLYENRNICIAGTGGRLVYWFTRFKESGDPWTLLYPDPSCIYSEKPRDIGDQIRESILSEFQSRPIAPAIMTLQPSPHTLVGLHTNFYVDAGQQVFDFLLLEQEIRIVARPTEYEWNYGDGTVYGPTPIAGAPLVPERWGDETGTSHVYRATGDFEASVIVHFSGEYSVNGGPMVPIDGRATVPSVPQTIQVWKADSRNVADDCLVNPRGYGC